MEGRVAACLPTGRVVERREHGGPLPMRVCVHACARRWSRRRAWRRSSRAQPNASCARAPSSVRHACACVCMQRVHAQPQRVHALAHAQL